MKGQFNMINKDLNPRSRDEKADAKAIGHHAKIYIETNIHKCVSIY